ncbi:MAG: hypothetical protein PVJ38_00015 [Candidatus Bathyarchaeota archaeon]
MLFIMFIWWNLALTTNLSVCKLTGGELWWMMEENLEHIFSRNPCM